MLKLKHENVLVITTLFADTNIVLCNGINQNNELDVSSFQVSNSACSLDKIVNLNISNVTNDGKFKHGDEFDSFSNQMQACKKKHLKGKKMFPLFFKYLRKCDIALKFLFTLKIVPKNYIKMRYI